MSSSEFGIQRLSESVFAGLCRKVGTPTQITFRREVQDITDIFRNRKASVDGHFKIMSGSHREGFRLEGSDMDMMFFNLNFNVVWGLDEVRNYDLDEEVVFLCDSCESPPGFTLLKLVLSRNITSEQKKAYHRIPLINMNNNFYISSSKLRQMISRVSSSFTEHGPCINGYLGNKEFDIAECIYCKFWPPSASSWLDRSHSWPKPKVAHEIVRNGCHLVAIGHKLGHHKDHEWRISFSQAEQKLVYSMNHSQFLTYGLLKIFLKEVINSGIDAQNKLLCSYHMKTSVFWVIQQNAIPNLSPQNLLECFWICFKLLLKWVYDGVCPNFFIPENNMFFSKIHGVTQSLLFIRLYKLYEKGISCLLHSPTIRPYIMKVLYNPRQYISTDEFNPRQSAKPEILLYCELLAEIYNSRIVLPLDLHGRIESLQSVENLIKFPMSQYQVLWFQKQTAVFFYAIAFLLINRWTSTVANKLMYRVDKMSCHMLRLAAKFGSISDILFIAMYYYRTFRYMKALYIIEMTKVKLAQTQELYNYIDTKRFCERAVGVSFSAMIMQVIAKDIQLHAGCYYMNELIPELCRLKQGATLCINPLVLTYMLEILCCIHTDTIRAQRALNNLQALVHFNHSYVFDIHKDISWQILGICQQIMGDFQSALFSYQQSLIQIPKHKIQSVTLMRILDIMTTTPA